MSAELAAKTGTGGKLVIRNIGLLLSGDLQKPILDGGHGGGEGRADQRDRPRERIGLRRCDGDY